MERIERLNPAMFDSQVQNAYCLVKEEIYVYDYGAGGRPPTVQRMNKISSGACVPSDHRNPHKAFVSVVIDLALGRHIVLPSPGRPSHLCWPLHNLNLKQSTTVSQALVYFITHNGPFSVIRSSDSNSKAIPFSSCQAQVHF